MRKRGSRVRGTNPTLCRRGRDNLERLVPLSYIPCAIVADSVTAAVPIYLSGGPSRTLLDVM